MDIDLNQGDPPPHSSKHLCDVKYFWHYVVSLTFDDGTSAIYLLPPCVLVDFLYLRTILIGVELEATSAELVIHQLVNRLAEWENPWQMSSMQ